MYVSFCFQSPPKGATIPYRPKPPVAGPVILAGGQAYTIQGNYAVPAHGDVSSPCLPPLGLGPPLYPPPAGLCDPLLKNGHLQAALPPAHLAAACEVSHAPLLTPPSPHTCLAGPPNPRPNTAVSFSFLLFSLSLISNGFHFVLIHFNLPYVVLQCSRSFL